MSYGLIAVIIVIGIVIGAIATKKCEPFLIAGSIIGALFLYKQNFITEWVATLEEVMSARLYVFGACLDRLFRYISGIEVYRSQVDFARVRGYCVGWLDGVVAGCYVYGAKRGLV